MTLPGNLEIGKRIREERLRLGFSQKDLAQIGKVVEGSQSLYERGKPPKSDYLAAIAKKGLDVQYILTGQRSETGIREATPMSDSSISDEEFIGDDDYEPPSTGTQIIDRALFIRAGIAIEEHLADNPHLKIPPRKKALAYLAAHDVLLESEQGKDKIDTNKLENLILLAG